MFGRFGDEVQESLDYSPSLWSAVDQATDVSKLVASSPCFPWQIKTNVNGEAGRAARGE